MKKVLLLLAVVFLASCSKEEPVKTEVGIFKGSKLLSGGVSVNGVLSYHSVYKTYREKGVLNISIGEKVENAIYLKLDSVKNKTSIQAYTPSGILSLMVFEGVNHDAIRMPTVGGFIFINGIFKEKYIIEINTVVK